MHGPYDPANGHRCNPAKLLLDPYAKAIEGQIDGDESLFSYRFADADEVAQAVEPAEGEADDAPPPAPRSTTTTRPGTR